MQGLRAALLNVVYALLFVVMRGWLMYEMTEFINVLVSRPLTFIHSVIVF